MDNNKLQQDHYKVKPKTHENPAPTSPGDEGLEKPASTERIYVVRKLMHELASSDFLKSSKVLKVPRF